MYALGLVLFALGIVACLALHEAGHALTARAFGMRVNRFFIGFGPTLWSFRRGGTEFGVKAIPAGAFVRIAGMTPDDDEQPEDESRALWRQPVWKRTIVFAAGSLTHFTLGVLILWGLFAFIPLPDSAQLQSQPVRVDNVVASSAASTLGLRAGDVITAIDGEPVTGWDALVAKLRASRGQTIDIAYARDGQTHLGSVMLAEKLGVTPVVPESTAGPVDAVPLAFKQTGMMFEHTFQALLRLPEKIPALFVAVTGGERDPETPVSVVGASHIGGLLAEREDTASFLAMLAALNFFIGLFNLLPVLPADGGRIAIAWFEKIRGRVIDYDRLAPVTFVAIIIFAVYTLLTVAADLISPVQLPN